MGLGWRSAGAKGSRQPTQKGWAFLSRKGIRDYWVSMNDRVPGPLQSNAQEGRDSHWFLCNQHCSLEKSRKCFSGQVGGQQRAIMRSLSVTSKPMTWTNNEGPNWRAAPCGRWRNNYSRDPCEGCNPPLLSSWPHESVTQIFEEC